MLEKDHLKLVGSIIVNIVLLAIYVYAFGQHSITKYLNKGVIIVTDEIQNSILPPGRHTIFLMYVSCKKVDIKFQYGKNNI